MVESGVEVYRTVIVYQYARIKGKLISLLSSPNGTVLVMNIYKKTFNPYILVVHLENSNAEEAVMRMLHQNTNRHVLKGKTFSKDGREELTVEVLLENGESGFVREIQSIPNVEDVVMVSYNGDYMQ